MRLDRSTRDGAAITAGEIEAYWRERGYEVKAEVVSALTHEHGSVWAVRSDMVNGMPVRRA